MNMGEKRRKSQSLVTPFLKWAKAKGDFTSQVAGQRYMKAGFKKDSVYSFLYKLVKNKNLERTDTGYRFITGAKSEPTGA
jgi:hypothetical protein